MSRRPGLRRSAPTGNRTGTRCGNPGGPRPYPRPGGGAAHTRVAHRPSARPHGSSPRNRLFEGRPWGPPRRRMGTLPSAGTEQSPADRIGHAGPRQRDTQVDTAVGFRRWWRPWAPRSARVVTAAPPEPARADPPRERIDGVRRPWAPDGRRVGLNQYLNPHDGTARAEGRHRTPRGGSRPGRPLRRRRHHRRADGMRAPPAPVHRPLPMAAVHSFGSLTFGATPGRITGDGRMRWPPPAGVGGSALPEQPGRRPRGRRSLARRSACPRPLPRARPPPGVRGTARHGAPGNRTAGRGSAAR